MAYDAFISYSHSADFDVAADLQTGLHRLAKPWWRLRAMRVFRDETDLTVNPHLQSEIEQQMDQSTWFILLASEAAARSDYVAAEIDHWLEHEERRDRFLVVVTDGDLVWDPARGDWNPVSSTSAPAPLFSLFTDEPRYHDLRWAEQAAPEERTLKNPGDPCPTSNVVTIGALDIGTTNTPASQIMFDDPATGANNFTNTFWARPTNNMPSDPIDPNVNEIDVGDLTATFRIANWGSQVGQGVSWQKIAATGVVNPASNTLAIPAGTQAGPTSITLDWKLETDQVNDFTQNPHQCLLVELAGPGLTILPNAVYRNMDFVEASVFERPATISNVGLVPNPAQGQMRDAYIVVHRRNMPQVVERPRPDGLREQGEEGRAVRVRDELVQAAEDDATELFLKEAREPNIRYYVYHDTGERITGELGAKDRVVLAPGVPFGFFVNHRGPINGWADEIVGAVKLADNLYKLPVPDGGSEKITTRVEALEGGCVAMLARIWNWLRGLFA